MTRNNVRFRRFIKIMLGLGVVCSIPPDLVYAQTEPRAIADISVTGTSNSNPFLETNGRSALSATLEIDPAIYWEDERITASINGGLRISQYADRYGTDIGARLAAQANERLDERTSLFARAGFQTSRSTLQDNFFGKSDAALNPADFPAVTLTDVTIFGRRNRVNSLDASVGVDRSLSANDSIEITAATSYLKFGGSVGLDYRAGSVSFQYGRQLTERLMITASFEARTADFIGINNGDAKFLSPRIGIQRQLSESLKWSANIGISYAAVNDQFRATRNIVYISGNFSICNSGLNRMICGSVSRSAGPTALGGISAVTNAAFNFEQKLNLRDRFTLSGRYGRTDQNSNMVLVGTRGTNQIIGVLANFSRDISERLSLVVTSSFTNIAENELRRASNYSAMLGVKFRLGKLR